MKLYPGFSKRIVVITCVFILCVGCEKNDDRQYPSELYNSRPWHHAVYKLDLSVALTGWTDSTFYPDIDEGVIDLGGKMVSFHGIKFTGNAGTNPIVFAGENIVSGTSEYMYYNYTRDSIYVYIDTTTSSLRTLHRYWTD